MTRLLSLFDPERVAVIGATERPGSIGRAVMENLVATFDGDVVPVNPSRSTVLGLECVPSVRAIGGEVDLGIVVVPAQAAVDVVEELAAAGVRNVVVISAGFGEVDDAGRARQRRLTEIAADHELNLVGPNSLGIINAANGLNATFADQRPIPGSISLMSQSGAFITAALDWAAEHDLGFRHVVSLGNEAVLDEVDFVAAWTEDPGTDVVLGYVEDIERGSRFIDTARRVTAETPVVLLKSGRSTAGARAAASHTGSIAGSDHAYDAAFRQGGVIRAGTMEELFDVGRALATQPPPDRGSVAIVTNAGGPGVLAADAVGDGSLQLADFSEETVAALAEALPASATVTNPLDVIGDAPPDRFEAVLEPIMRDEAVGGVIVMAAPTAIFEHGELATLIGERTRGYPGPVIGCLMGGAAATRAAAAFDGYGIPNYVDPARAVLAMEAVSRYGDVRRRPVDEPRRFVVDDDRVRSILASAVDAGRTQLGAEAMGVLDAYGIPTPDGTVVTGREEAAAVASRLGDPVVMKVVSPDIVHKTDVGGVRVGVDRGDVPATYDDLVAVATERDPPAEVVGVHVQELVTMEDGVETIAGVTRDPQFGPLVMHGLGGIFVEALADVAFRVAPLGEADARALTAEFRGASMLRGARGRRPGDVEAVVGTLQRLSQLATTFPAIEELDVNPLLVGPAGAVALDFRATLSDDAPG